MRPSFFARLPASGLIRAACVFGLIALFAMSLGIFLPYALPVILSMSLGHVFIALCIACYLLAIISEIARNEARAERSRRSAARHDER